MSFNAEAENPNRSGGHASKRQPKQSRNEDTSFEREIKSNIQEMQDGIRMALERLEQAQRGALSIRAKQSLDTFLDVSQELVKGTERQFREWTVHFAGEPMERHRKRPSFEKLQRAFEKEVEKLKEITSRYAQVKQEAMMQQQAAVECQPMCAEQDSAQGDASCEDNPLLGVDAQELEQDSEVHNRIVHERDEGIRRIHDQVSEVNQMFKDLASVVTSQGEQLASIDHQAEEVAATTKEAVQELRKAAKRQSGTRENLCYMLLAAVALLCFLVVPHLSHTTSYDSPGVAGSDHVGVLRGSRPDDIVIQEGTVEPELAPQYLPRNPAFAEEPGGLTEAQMAAFTAGLRSTELQRMAVQPVAQEWNRGQLQGQLQGNLEGSAPQQWSASPPSNLSEERIAAVEAFNQGQLRAQALNQAQLRGDLIAANAPEAFNQGQLRAQAFQAQLRGDLVASAAPEERIAATAGFQERISASGEHSGVT